MNAICEKQVIFHKLVVILISLCLFGYSNVTGEINTYYLEDYCTRQLDMTLANVKSGRLLLHRPGQNPRYLDCYIKIKAPTSKRLTFKFHSFDVKTSTGCNLNFVQIYEDHQLQFPITEKLCNRDRIPNSAYITNGEEAVVRLFKESYQGDQMELVFTAFSFSPCVGGDYQCDNAHCISSDLYCKDEFDNCGDESDICLLKRSTVIGIIAAVAALVIIFAIVFALYMFRRQQKIRREKMPIVLLIPPDKDQKSLSFISEGNSSTLPKNLSLSDRRDLELQTLYYAGSQVHAFGYRPFPSPMGSQYSSMTRNGGVLESNLDKKTLPSIQSKPSDASAEKMSRPVKRSRSSDLKAPFYFDRDGYLSDSSVSQTNSFDRGGRQKIEKEDAKNEKKDAKKKKKFGVKFKKKKSKLGKQKAPEPPKNTSGEISEMIDKENTAEQDLGHEEMTQVQYMDGSPLFNALTNPEIRVTPVRDPEEYQMLEKGRNKDNSFISTRRSGSESNIKEEIDRTGKRAQFGNESEDSADHWKEVTNQLISRRRASRPDNPPLDIQALKMPRTAMTAINAMVHNVDEDTPTVIETTTTEGPQLNRTASSHDIPIGIHTTRLHVKAPDSTVEMKPKLNDDQMENYNEEQKDYPQTNSQLEEQTLSTSLDPTSPITAGILSPTRQMGLSARHQDGSPFLLHKVSTKAVENQLKQHPEDGANVRDHVISFRSYQSPIPSLERAGLFRNSARNSAKLGDKNKST